MGRLQMKNVTQRHGHLYFRRKVAGKDTYIRLPALSDPSFQAEYERLSRQAEPKAGPIPRSLGALVVEVRRSADWQAKDGRTKLNQARFLDWIADHHGHRSVKGMRPVHVFAMRDEFTDTPGNAAIFLSVIKSMMRLAVRLDWRGDNPAAEVPMLAIGEHEPWPAELIEACLSVATPMTRLAIITGLCSGQRVGDCVRMQYGWISDGIMSFTQQKRRKATVRRKARLKYVAVPMHPLWREELTKLPRRAVTLLYDRAGAPFKSAGAIQDRMQDLMAKPAVQRVIADLVAAEVIEEDATFSFHGLRKNACCYLLELGLNDSEVGSLLGMSPEMVRHYGKRARALMIARGVADRVSGGTVALLPGARTVSAANAGSIK